MSANPGIAARSGTDNRASFLARMCRKALRHRLRGLQHGKLRVRDPLGNWSVGEDGELDAELDVFDLHFYADAVLEGSLGVAGSWSEGIWNTPDLTTLLRLMVRNMDKIDAMEGGAATVMNLVARFRHWGNRNSRNGSARNIHEHYDLGNDLFATFLDDSMTYSSGIYLTEESSLADAQFEKLDRICRKLALKPEHHVVEIGTGWGSFAIHAAKHYGCKVTTTTISEEQLKLAQQRVLDAGLQDLIELKLTDYRDLEGQYDRLVSIEMIEAVGHQYLPVYFEQCAALLKPEGSMVIQAINMPDQRYDQYLKSTDFIQAVVFPGSCCAALTAIMDAMKSHTDLKLVHLEDIGRDYARTLADWRHRFRAAINDVYDLGYSQAFARMWVYYLSYCEAGFAERYTSTTQLMFEKPRCGVA